MKREVMGMPGQVSRKSVIVLAAIALLFPSSARVLCIAPGLHVQEEDIDAPCPAASGITAPADYHPKDGFNVAEIRHCTDIFLTPHGRGALLEASNQVAPRFFSEECPGGQPLEVPLCPLVRLCIQGIQAPDFLNGPDFPASPVPLRC